MTPDTVRALRAINERFYRTNAELFASKRTRPWPGMEQLIETLPTAPRRVLDVGCGHGRFAAHLATRHPQVEYTGVDGSAELLATARARGDMPADSTFLQAEIDEGAGSLPRGPFDLVTLIAVLHHVPGEDRRHALLRTLATRVAPGGVLALAFWRRVGDVERRRVPWSEVGLDPADLEPGDQLVSFDREPSRLRFSHFADDAELGRVAGCTDLPVLTRFLADGPDADANAYFLWQRPA